MVINRCSWLVLFRASVTDDLSDCKQCNKAGTKLCDSANTCVCLNGYGGAYCQKCSSNYSFISANNTCLPCPCDPRRSTGACFYDTGKYAFNTLATKNSSERNGDEKYERGQSERDMISDDRSRTGRNWDGATAEPRVHARQQQQTVSRALGVWRKLIATQGPSAHNLLSCARQMSVCSAARIDVHADDTADGFREALTALGGAVDVQVNLHQMDSVARVTAFALATTCSGVAVADFGGLTTVGTGAHGDGVEYIDDGQDGERPK